MTVINSSKISNLWWCFFVLFLIEKRKQSFSVLKLMEKETFMYHLTSHPKLIMKFMV